MGEARDLLDRMTKAVLDGDTDTLADCYAEDAVLVTRDYGELQGRAAIVDYFRPYFEAFSDIGWEEMHRHEAGNAAIDEGFFTGTHTAPLPNPDGEPVPATGNGSGCASATSRPPPVVASPATACTSTRWT